MLLLRFQTNAMQLFTLILDQSAEESRLVFVVEVPGNASCYDQWLRVTVNDLQPVLVLTLYRKRRLSLLRITFHRSK